MLYRLWCLICYWTVLHFPFSIYNKIAWRIYLWLMPYAGVEAYRRGEL
jgi:hypothetical protein